MSVTTEQKVLNKKVMVNMRNVCKYICTNTILATEKYINTLLKNANTTFVADPCYPIQHQSNPKATNTNPWFALLINLCPKHINICRNVAICLAKIQGTLDWMFLPDEYNYSFVDYVCLFRWNHMIRWCLTVTWFDATQLKYLSWYRNCDDLFGGGHFFQGRYDPGKCSHNTYRCGGMTAGQQLDLFQSIESLQKRRIARIVKFSEEYLVLDLLPLLLSYENK